jgi:hypothetical protein
MDGPASAVDPPSIAGALADPGRAGFSRTVSLPASRLSPELWDGIELDCLPR